MRQRTRGQNLHQMAGYPGLAAALLESAIRKQEPEFFRTPLGGACAELLGIDDIGTLIQRAEESAEAH